MLGFSIEHTQEGEMLEVFIYDEAAVQYPLNEENMRKLECSLHNELLDCQRIMREKGWDK